MKQSKGKKRIIKMINWDEPDYLSLTNKLTEEDYLTLNELASHKNIGISSRAIICLGWSGYEKSIDGIAFAAKSKNPVLRLAAAQALNKMSTINNIPAAVQLISGLLDDDDIGVKKFALKTTGISKISSLKGKIQQISLNEPNEQIKKLAKEVFQKLEIADDNTTTL